MAAGSASSHGGNEEQQQAADAGRSGWKVRIGQTPAPHGWLAWRRRVDKTADWEATAPAGQPEPCEVLSLT
jgi:hypothetical protein